MKILITGGAGFIGSNAAQYFANKGHDIICYDNLSRFLLLKKKINFKNNWKELQKNKKIKLIKGDVRDFLAVKKAMRGVDAVIHASGQTAVTASIRFPREDFETNFLGTFNVLEAARLSPKKPSIIYCSTNKVYGERVNEIGLIEKKKRYEFVNKYKEGISETFSIDYSKHTPYGCSKLCGDLYVQEYGRLYGLKTGVFRMSCIYGERQYGVEDQGWVAWFVLAALLGKPINIYGDGKQVRDILYIGDLVQAHDLFLQSKIKSEVFNMGGGKENTLSLLELIDLLEKTLGKKIQYRFKEWRSSDQKVYISDISKVKKMLGWDPKVSPTEGIVKMADWIKNNLA